MPFMTRKNLGLHVLLALCVAAFFAWNVWRYYFLGDDGFIAFRFSKNLVEGHGLVYNPGERVEGYTQLLWVLLLALGMKLGALPEILANVIGIACGAGILFALLLLSRRVTPGAGLWIWVAPLCLAVNRSFCAWSTGGLETQSFVLLVLLSLSRFAREWDENARWPLGSGLLFAVATLSRPEGGLFCAAAGLLFAADVFVRRRRPFSSLLLWSAPFLLIVGAHFLWRYDYYGYWLPNTFYAKVSGFWWEQSSVFLWLFLRDHLLLSVLPLLLLLAAQGRAVYALFLVSIALYTAYIIYIGGDRFEYRFMTPLLPLLYWLLQESLRILTDLLARARALRGGATAIGAVLAVGVAGTSALPLVRGFVPESGIAGIESVGEYAVLRSAEGKFFRRLVDEGYLCGDELIATRGAGAMPYYSGFPILDLHGLNDVVIAHTPIERRGVISHEKVATVDYVRERGAVLCNVLNRFVFDENEEQYRNLMNPLFSGFHPYFPKPIRCVRALGKYIVFGTTLAEEDFLRVFARFDVIR